MGVPRKLDETAMDHLILKSLQNEATEEDAQALAAWRSAAVENESYYQECVRAWMLAQVGEEVGTPTWRPSANEILGLARRRRVVELPVASGHRPTRGWLWSFVGLTAAAALLVAIGLAWRMKAPPSRGDVGINEFVTARMEKAIVSLKDGTVVRLAPESRLRLNGAENEREVSLTGHGYFAVAHREDKPFRIHTNAGVVTVLGTRFDLDVEGDDLKLIVVEGRVVLAAAGSRVPVNAGEVGQVRAGALLPTIRVPNVPDLVNWLGNFLAFQNTPLSEVAREIERQYGIRIIIADPTLGQRTVTTWLADRSVEEVLQVVCAVAFVDCKTHRDRTVTIRQRHAR